MDILDQTSDKQRKLTTTLTQPAYLGVVESVAPQVLEHLLGFGAHLGGVHLGEFFEGETPAVEAGSETDSSVIRADLSIAKNAAYL